MEFFVSLLILYLTDSSWLQFWRLHLGRSTVYPMSLASLETREPSGAPSNIHAILAVCAFRESILHLLTGSLKAGINTEVRKDSEGRGASFPAEEWLLSP